MNKFVAIATATAAVALTAGAANAQTRDQIQIVGSSTVFPFTTAVAEQFARNTEYPAPVVESTGTGGGMRLFCAGIGEAHPDFSGASRAMRESEYNTCIENGVDSVSEMLIGYDGIVLGVSQAGEAFDASKEELFQALAKFVEVDGEIVENPYTMWSEISPDLPDVEIQVFGPPPTSGTRDAWVELVMEEGCESFDAIAALEESDEERFEEVCQSMREDGLFIEAGENDNLIVQRLEADPTAYGIFGFSFLDQNQDVLNGVNVEGAAPTFENIADESYPVSRPLFVYIKNAHRDVIPGMNDFIAEYLSDRASGADGYLIDRGLIPLDEATREQVRTEVMNAEHLDRFM